jgi:hypothetical protein
MLEIRTVPTGYSETVDAICAAYHQGFNDCRQAARAAIASLELQRPILHVQAGLPDAPEPNLPTAPGLYHWMCTADGTINPLPAFLASFMRSRVVLPVVKATTGLLAWLPGVKGATPVEELAKIGTWGKRVETEPQEAT